MTISIKSTVHYRKKQIFVIGQIKICIQPERLPGREGFCLTVLCQQDKIIFTGNRNDTRIRSFCRICGNIRLGSQQGYNKEGIDDAPW